MLGVEDPLVALALVLCLASSALCVTYAWINWNRGDDTVRDEDRKWAAQEKRVEEDL